mmetsp:Transcript_41413/g.68151  ORF Transcript_41413/g.68151 Transcript_41413/m.68151 type:complete len:153 (+) Transcript_41413:187-645(+)
MSLPATTMYDPCVASYSETQCSTITSDNGDKLCAYNAVKNVCYSISRATGLYGRGDYDDGFVAAHQLSEQQNIKLQTLIGVLSATLVLLVVVGVVIGVLYFKRRKRNAENAQMDEQGIMSDHEEDRVVTQHHLAQPDSYGAEQGECDQLNVR